MTKQTVFLALGSNLGARRENLRRASAALPPGVSVLAESPVYETPPWGVTEQPKFLNMVLMVETALEPVALLKHLKEIETRLGRTATIRYGPRVIDLDILFYGNRVLTSPELSLPHPRLHERAFVLVPLADLAPDLIHPTLGKSIRELLETVDKKGIERYER
jgi:2-amino-4-hydroxy-6-hydroxymethyldihydropteridine diphosphokinase